MDRKAYLEKDDIRLLYAESEDRCLIHGMAFEEEGIWRAMIRQKEEFPLSALTSEKDEFFGAAPGLNKYLLIEHRGAVVGVISHSHYGGEIPVLELDTWLRSEKHCGKGIGSSAMRALIAALVSDKGIKTFIIRPWARNRRAIKAYEKCGFRRRGDFEPSRYYGKYLELWGEGDFGAEETCNMVLEID